MLTAADFDYELLPELIAERPAAARDQARLLLVGEGRDGQGYAHHSIADLPSLVSAQIGPRTLLVLNDTKVLPARLRGHKLHEGASGGRLEFLLLQAAEPQPGRCLWQAMYRSSKPLRPGQKVRLQAPVGEDSCEVTVVEGGGGEALLDFGDLSDDAFYALLDHFGEVPLPPYIERARERTQLNVDREEDRQRYQTVFARIAGSVAAPTAGLHFTPALLAALQAAGHDYVRVTLHVGPGTFMPLRTDSLSEHVMHSERYHISPETAEAIAAARAAGRRILAVGTTVVRTLESATPEGAVAPRTGWGETRLFIYPPYRFRAVDALLTNFHLPRSTLLMLVAALVGRQRILDAYAVAIAAGYRFYSFGDAMLIPRRYAETTAP